MASLNLPPLDTDKTKQISNEQTNEEYDFNDDTSDDDNKSNSNNDNDNADVRNANSRVIKNSSTNESKNDSNDNINEIKSDDLDAKLEEDQTYMLHCQFIGNGENNTNVSIPGHLLDEFLNAQGISNNNQSLTIESKVTNNIAARPKFNSILTINNKNHKNNHNNVNSLLNSKVYSSAKRIRLDDLNTRLPINDNNTFYEKAQIRLHNAVINTIASVRNLQDVTITPPPENILIDASTTDHWMTDPLLLRLLSAMTAAPKNTCYDNYEPIYHIVKLYFVGPGARQMGTNSYRIQNALTSVTNDAYHLTSYMTSDLGEIQLTSGGFIFAPFKKEGGILAHLQSFDIIEGNLINNIMQFKGKSMNLKLLPSSISFPGAIIDLYAHTSNFKAFDMPPTKLTHELCTTFNRTIRNNFIFYFVLQRHQMGTFIGVIDLIKLAVTYKLPIVTGNEFKIILTGNYSNDVLDKYSKYETMVLNKLHDNDYSHSICIPPIIPDGKLENMIQNLLIQPTDIVILNRAVNLINCMKGKDRLRIKVINANKYAIIGVPKEKIIFTSKNMIHLVKNNRMNMTNGLIKAYEAPKSSFYAILLDICLNCNWCQLIGKHGKSKCKELHALLKNKELQLRNQFPMKDDIFIQNQLRLNPIMVCNKCGSLKEINHVCKPNKNRRKHPVDGTQFNVFSISSPYCYSTAKYNANYILCKLLNININAMNGTDMIVFHTTDGYKRVFASWGIEQIMERQLITQFDANTYTIDKSRLRVLITEFNDWSITPLYDEQIQFYITAQNEANNNNNNNNNNFVRASALLPNDI